MTKIIRAGTSKCLTYLCEKWLEWLINYQNGWQPIFFSATDFLRFIYHSCQPHMYVRLFLPRPTLKWSCWSWWKYRQAARVFGLIENRAEHMTYTNLDKIPQIGYFKELQLSYCEQDALHWKNKVVGGPTNSLSLTNLWQFCEAISSVHPIYQTSSTEE